MSASLSTAAAAYSAALLALRRSLDETRAQWNDATRRAFDQRHADPILMAGKKTETQLKGLAAELAGAIQELDRADSPKGGPHC
jgi:hypothetical protein